MDTFYHLEQAEHHLREATDDLNNAPEKADIAQLLKAVAGIDLHYKKMCKEMDDDNGDPEGTTYEEGVSIEFYIEADWWHDVSLAFRNLT